MPSKDDRGGIDIDTFGACEGNLQAAWDGCLIERTLGHDVSSITEMLSNELTPSQRAERTNSSPVDWANESLTIATSSPVGYCVHADGICTYDTGNPSLDLGESIRSICLDGNYVEAT